LADDAALELSGTTIAVADGEDLVAALRLHAADTPHLRRELGALLRLERFAGSWPQESLVVGSRLAVLADYRTRPVIDLLMREAYRLVRDSGVRFGLISCTPELHALFAFYGFREYLPPAILPGGTATLRMALVCEYLPDLDASGSPLVDLVRQPEIGDSAHAWLAQAFPMLG
jgi:GNAT superfamily N-acetyltransferase